MTLEQREANLLPLAQAGDHQALLLLIDMVWSRIQHRVSKRIPDTLRSIIDPDDIFAETLFQMSRKISRFVSRGPDALRRFVTAVALCRLRDRLREHCREGRRVSITEAAEPRSDDEVLSGLVPELLAKGPTPSGLVARAEAIAILRSAFEALPPEEHEILRLHYFEKLSVREAGRRMGLPETTARRLCAEAQARLQRELGNRSNYLSSTA